MTTDDPVFWPAARLARALRARKLGALELFERYAARIERFNSALNAICAVDLDAGRKAAKAADRTRGRRGPLHGLPMTVKESFDLAGFATTWGLPEFKGNVARRDALAVERLADARAPGQARVRAGNGKGADGHGEPSPP